MVCGQLSGVRLAGLSDSALELRSTGQPWAAVPHGPSRNILSGVSRRFQNRGLDVAVDGGQKFVAEIWARCQQARDERVAIVATQGRVIEGRDETPGAQH